MPPAARAGHEQGPPTNEYALPAGKYAPSRAPVPEQAAAPRQQEVSVATISVPAPVIDVAAEADAKLRLMREGTTRRIGETIVFVFLAMVAVVMGAAFYVTDSTKIQILFQLLGLVSPLCGVVLGYYFGKVTAEARAEKAEAQATVNAVAARDAAAAADAATEASQRAWEGQQQAQEEAESLDAQLGDLEEKARAVLTAAEPAGDEGDGQGAMRGALRGPPGA